MVKIEVLINHIKEARIKGFRDDFIGKELFEKGYPEEMIYDAFANAAGNKRAGITSITIVLKSSEKDLLEKKAKKDGLTLREEIKKKLIEGIPASYLPKGVSKSTLIKKMLASEKRDKNNEAVKRSRAKSNSRRRKN